MIGTLVAQKAWFLTAENVVRKTNMATHVADIAWILKKDRSNDKNGNFFFGEGGGVRLHAFGAGRSWERAP